MEATCPVISPEEGNLHPEWIRNAVLYEVNLRQYTPEGTLKAFTRELPRLKSLGVDVLWFMPLFPIGEAGRKGTLGSYYSVRDYCAVNPEFGDMEDLKECVRQAHQLGMKTILDWVAAHTSRDAVWLSHYDWYHRNEDGSPAYLYDWSDVARLNFDNQQMREAMLEAFLFWIEEARIDGFRCDMAELVPLDFWKWAIPRIKTRRKDLFFLAECENPAYMGDCFESFYTWKMHHILNDVAQGRKNVYDIRAALEGLSRDFGSADIPMFFTSNHDENSWNGSAVERLGPCAQLMAALTFLLPGIPLIYSGQEFGNNRRLQFFEKDAFSHEDKDGFTPFYQRLTSLKKQHPALDVPPYGGSYREIATSAASQVLAFTRQVGTDGVLAVFNFSPQQITFRFTDYSPLLPSDQMSLQAFDYKIITN